MIEALEDIDINPLKLLVSASEHFINEDYDLAIADYTAVLEIDAGCLEARVWRARAYCCNQDIDKEYAEWQMLLQTNPDFALKLPEVVEWFVELPARLLECEAYNGPGLPF